MAAAAAGLALAALMTGPATSLAAEDEGPEFSRRGADQCLGCHDDAYIVSIFRTPHGQPADPSSPMGNLQCEACHGAGGEHAARLREGEPRPPIANFGKDEEFPVAEQNRVCLDCHTRDVSLAWHGSAHDNEELSCASCHSVHTPTDAVLDRRGGQAEVCYDCHASQRAQVSKPSAHPVLEGKVACADCHNAHNSVTDALLARENVNQLCYTCHAETRGPFLWEHAPVVEDCGNCHEPHGSNHPALLTRRPPLLCQQCHSQADHPSTPYTPDSLPGGRPSAYLVGGSCLNCHSQVHGSNHPSGAVLMR